MANETTSTFASLMTGSGGGAGGKLAESVTGVAGGGGGRVSRASAELGSAARLTTTRGILARKFVVGGTFAANMQVAACTQGAMSNEEMLTCLANLRVNCGMDALSANEDGELLIAVLEVFVMRGGSELAYTDNFVFNLVVCGTTFRVTANQLVGGLFAGIPDGSYPIKRFTRANAGVVVAILKSAPVQEFFFANFKRSPLEMRSELLPKNYQIQYDHMAASAAKLRAAALASASVDSDV